MWLINAKTLELEEHLPGQVPQYCILSHTWGKDEPTHEEVKRLGGRERQGYQKVVETCRLTLEHGVEHAWVDTCCIDKKSSAELSEAINSMFAYYRDARVCFVWLEDMDSSDFDTREYLPRCRWITRGWTLQELLAPALVKFFDANWTYRGSKLGWRNFLAHATKIPSRVLEDSQYIHKCSVAMRMAWASSRSTTRAEDMAYCLLGLFDVNIPLIYGEGRNAFRRLQEEIVKRNNDLTIFAWDNVPTSKLEFLGMLASEPACFKNSHDVTFLAEDRAGFTIGNDLLMRSGLSYPPLRIYETRRLDGSLTVSYLLLLGATASDGLVNYCRIGVSLRKLGPAIFCRETRDDLARLDNVALSDSSKIDQVFEKADLTILIDPPKISISNMERSFRQNCVHVVMSREGAAVPTWLAPMELWDESDTTFLTPSPYGWSTSSVMSPIVICVIYTISMAGFSLNVAVFCYHDGNRVFANLLNLSAQSGLQERVMSFFNGVWGVEIARIAGLRDSIPGAKEMSDKIVIDRDGVNYVMSVGLRPERRDWAKDGMVFTPTLDIESVESRGQRVDGIIGERHWIAGA